MFKNFLNKYRNEVKELTKVFTLYLGLIGIVYIIDIVYLDNKHMLQKDIVNLLFFTNTLCFCFTFNKKLTGIEKILPLAICSVNVLALFIIVFVMGARYSI